MIISNKGYCCWGSAFLKKDVIRVKSSLVASVNSVSFFIHFFSFVSFLNVDIIDFDEETSSLIVLLALWRMDFLVAVV